MNSVTVYHKQVSTNVGYKRGQGRGLYKTKELKEFQQAIREECRKVCEGAPDGRCSWFVGITFYFQSNRSDIDGSIKPVLDAMEGIIFENDNKVITLCVNKKKDASNPRTEIDWEVIDE